MQPFSWFLCGICCPAFVTMPACTLSSYWASVNKFMPQMLFKMVHDHSRMEVSLQVDGHILPHPQLSYERPFDPGNSGSWNLKDVRSSDA